MRKIKSNVDLKTTYHVTDKYITIHRDGESATVRYGTLDSFASRLKEGIRNELLDIRLEQRGRDCPICGRRFYSVKSKKYCTTECCQEGNRRYARKRQEELKSTKNDNLLKENIRKSNAGKIEREARKRGLHYADIQKQKTLAMIGRIEI